MSEYEIVLYRIIGEMIRDIRNSKNVTLDQIAEKIGVTPKTIQRYETADRKIKIETLKEIADYLKFDYDKFMEEATAKYVTIYNTDQNKFNRSSQSTRLSLYASKIAEISSKLNKDNQNKLLEFATKLYELQNIEEPILNAAHERPGATEDDKSHDDDIMDDENF